MNKDADALSRIIWEDLRSSAMPSDAVSALLQGKQCNMPLSETIYLAQQTVECDMEGSETSNSPDWKREQRKDANLLEVLNRQDKEMKVTSREGVMLLRSDLTVRQGVLYRRRTEDGGAVLQLVVQYCNRDNNTIEVRIKR